MMRKRLRIMNDVSPLYFRGALPAIEATRWSAEAQQDLDRVEYHDNGYTVTVFDNPLFSWYRTFTKDNTPIDRASSARSLFTIHEWVPSYKHGIHDRSWRTFGNHRYQAITPIPTDGPLEASWHSQTRSRLKKFLAQNDVTIRLGRFEEIKEPYFASNIVPSMKRGLWRLTERHVRDHGDTVDVLIAESKTDGIVAAFVAGNCDEAASSLYLLGFYLPKAAKTFAMIGLVHKWFERSQERGYKTCNFGDICGPNPVPFDSGMGYSFFKSHFGINRVWLPGSYWKFKIKA